MLQEFQSEDADDDPVRLLTEILGNEEAARTISDKFKKVSIIGGQTLFDQGDPGDALYLVLSGSASIVLNLPNGNTLHLRTMRTGAVFGEMALYTGAPRSASTLVKNDSFFYRLDQDAFDDLSTVYPAEAGLFHAFIVRLMAERLDRAAKEIMALSR